MSQRGEPRRRGGDRGHGFRDRGGGYIPQGQRNIEGHGFRDRGGGYIPPGQRNIEGHGFSQQGSLNQNMRQPPSLMNLPLDQSMPSLLGNAPHHFNPPPNYVSGPNSAFSRGPSGIDQARIIDQTRNAMGLSKDQPIVIVNVLNPGNLNSENSDQNSSSRFANYQRNVNFLGRGRIPERGNERSSGGRDRRREERRLGERSMSETRLCSNSTGGDYIGDNVSVGDRTERKQDFQNSRGSGRPYRSRGGQRGRAGRGPGMRQNQERKRPDTSTGHQVPKLILGEDGNVISELESSRQEKRDMEEAVSWESDSEEQSDHDDDQEQSSVKHNQHHAGRGSKHFPRGRRGKQFVGKGNTFEHKAPRAKRRSTSGEQESEVDDLLASLGNLSAVGAAKGDTRSNPSGRDNSETSSLGNKTYPSKGKPRKDPSSKNDDNSSDHTKASKPKVLPKPGEKFEAADKNVKKVFNILLQKYNGRTDFSLLMMEKDLPEEARTVSWFKTHKYLFLLFEKNEEVQFVSVYSKYARMCRVYNINDCPDPNCNYLHICMHFVTGGCKYPSCLSHNLFDGRNNNRIQELGLEVFKNKEVAKILRCSLPEWCEEYQRQGDRHVKACPLIHVCKNEYCTKQCGLEHRIKGSEHNRWILNTFGIGHYKDENLDQMLLHRQRNYKQVKMDKLRNEAVQAEVSPELPEVTKIDAKKYKTRARKAKKPKSLVSELGVHDTDIVTDLNSDSRPVPKPRARYIPQPQAEREPSESVSTESDPEPSLISFKSSSEDEEIEVVCDAEQQKSSQTQHLLDTDISEDRRERVEPLLIDLDSGSESQDEPSDLVLCEKHVWGQCSRHSHFHGMSHLPYQWQIHMHDGWVFFDQQENEKIEMAFCNRYRTCGDVKVSGSLMALITFDSMKALTYIKQFDGEDIAGDSVCVQRLSTPSYVTGTDNTVADLTHWCWYLYAADNTWLLYQPANLQYTLEMKYLNGQASYLFEREKFQYEVDFTKMQQTNLRTFKQRPVMRRPVFVSSDDVNKGKKISSPYLLSKMPSLLMTPPEGWALLDCHQIVELVKLNIGSTAEDEMVQNLFFSTMDRSQFKIRSLFRIQNPSLWSKYCSMKATMEMTHRQEGLAGPITERQLFHGTEDNVDVIRGICHNNVDFRLGGKNGTVYGEGAYFARDAKYSHSYTRGPVRFMFLCKVLVGQYARGQSSYKRPPAKAGHALYDSCVNDVTNPSVYVIFDIAQSYPEYLVEYTVGESEGSVAAEVPATPAESRVPRTASSTSAYPGYPSAYPSCSPTSYPSANPYLMSAATSGLSYPTSVPTHPTGISSFPAPVSTHPTGISSYPAAVSTHPTDISSYPAPLPTHPTGISSYPASTPSESSTAVPSFQTSAGFSVPSSEELHTQAGNINWAVQPTRKPPEEKCTIQ